MTVEGAFILLPLSLGTVLGSVRFALCRLPSFFSPRIIYSKSY